MIEPSRPTAVVTGGTSGIGAAVADGLLVDGFAVVVIARGAGGLAQENRLGIACDVSDRAALEAARDEVEARCGRVDALVNCAGVTALGGLEEMAVADIERLVAVNLLGVIYATRAFLRPLKRSRGCIVNVSSGLASRPLAGRAVYSATKGAIESFTKSLALEYGPSGVRANAVAPSVVRTGIWSKGGLSDDDQERMLRERGRTYPLGRVGEPEDVADAVRFLVSDRAKWITGCVLPVDGGSGLGAASRPPS